MYFLFGTYNFLTLCKVRITETKFSEYDILQFCLKDVKWSRKLYNECVRDKNMFFEIPYSPCIRDSTARRRIIAQSHNYHAVGKSKACLSIPRFLLFLYFFHIKLIKKSAIAYFNGLKTLSSKFY